MRICHVGALPSPNVINGVNSAVWMLAAAQARYLALQTEAQTARQNYERTAKLVKISPASNAELDQARADQTKADLDFQRAEALYAAKAMTRPDYDAAVARHAARYWKARGLARGRSRKARRTSCKAWYLASSWSG